MTTRYEVDGWVKYADEDVFENGCMVDGSTMCDGDDQFHADNIPDLLDKLKGFIAPRSDEDIQLDSCDEPGRVDIQTMEDADGIQASDSMIARWREGKLRLWACTYIFHVERVTREDVQLVATEVRI